MMLDFLQPQGCLASFGKPPEATNQLGPFPETCKRHFLRALLPLRGMRASLRQQGSEMFRLLPST